MNEKDPITTLQELKDVLFRFREDRDWKQYHDPKNLAEAISIEAGELLENFLWKEKSEIERDLSDEVFQQKVRHELADIICFCLNFANSTGIDVASAVLDKIQENNKKYPVHESKGNAKKYTQL